MNTQKQELQIRHELVQSVSQARTELGALTVARHKSAPGEAFSAVNAAFFASIKKHRDQVSAIREELIRSSIERRLSLIGPCQFQMMVDNVPYYSFWDHATGTRIANLAYGTEANRTMYQMKADLEKATRRRMARELEWADAAIESWTRMLEQNPVAARLAS